MSYIGNTPGVSSQRVVLEEVITGSPKSAFVPISGYIKGYVDVLINGVEIDTTDFTAPDGVTVTLGTAAAVGDTVKIKTWLPRGLSDGYLKSEADAKFAPLVNGNLIMAPNAGSNRVIGFASGTDTTLVLQGGGTSGSGANLELTRDYRAFLDATTSEVRSVDGSTVYAIFNSGGIALPAGKGIDFSASANASGATSEVLDDYEVGTWTPYLYGSSTTGTGTYNTVNNKGTYTKVGNLVTVGFSINCSSTHTGTGLIFVGGLPFGATGYTWTGGSIGYWAGLLTVTPASVGCYVDPGASGFVLTYVAGGAGSTSYLSPSHVQNGTHIIGSLTYRT